MLLCQFSQCTLTFLNMYHIFVCKKHKVNGRHEPASTEASDWISFFFSHRFYCHRSIWTKERPQSFQKWRSYSKVILPRNRISPKAPCLLVFFRIGSWNMESQRRLIYTSQAIIWLEAFLAGMFVIGRLWIRLKIDKGLKWDDFLTFLAFACLIIMW